MQKLKGKRVLITGGARGIGFETAIAFGREGCKVFITDINEEGLEDASSKIAASGVEVHTYVNDVADHKQVDKLAKEILSQFGGIDILINNAGIGFSAEIKDMTLEDWKRLMAVNIWGMIHFIHAFLPSMIEKRNGNIVNISSGQAFFPVPTWGAYAATKYFVAGMSEALHYEVARFGIKVTTVFPFMVRSPFYDDIKAQTPFGRLVVKGVVPIVGTTVEKTAKIIVKAVKKGKKNELHHIGNKIGYYFMRLTPHVVEEAGLGVAWAMSLRGKAD